MSAQAVISRQLSLNGFGFYNVDKPGIDRPKAQINNLIVMRNGGEEKVKSSSFMVVDLRRNAVVSIYGAPKYYKNKETILWTVLDEKEMAIVFPSQFKAMPEDKTLRVGVYSIQEGLELMSDIIALN